MDPKNHNRLSRAKVSKYLDKYDSTEGDTYTPASTAIIKITLSLTGADDVTATFEDRVYLNGVMTGT